MHKIISNIRKLNTHYPMLRPHDVVAVGISGGKDSMAMLCSLYSLNKYDIIPLTLHAIYVDVGFGECDDSEVKAYLGELGIPYHRVDTNIAEVIDLKGGVALLTV